MNRTTNQERRTAPASLPELIRTKEALLERLLSVSERQLKFVQEGDVSTLLQLLGHKQKLFDECMRIESRLEPYRSVPPEKRRWKSEAERLETAAAINRSADLHAEIIRLDEQSTQMMSEQRSAVETQLRRIQQGSRLHAAYSKQKR